MAKNEGKATRRKVHQTCFDEKKNSVSVTDICGIKNHRAVNNPQYVNLNCLNIKLRVWWCLKKVQTIFKFSDTNNQINNAYDTILW